MAKKIEFGGVELAGTFEDTFHDGVKTAHVKQSTTTRYLTQRGPFVQQESEAYNGSRYSFVSVPEDWTDEKIGEMIKDGHIIRIRGLRVQSVMTEGQLDWLESLQTAEEKADFLRDRENQFLVQDGEGNEVEYDDSGFVQFARNEFVLTRQEDPDFREADLAIMEGVNASTGEVTEPQQIAVEA